jgi:hypothetical protein
LGSGVDLAEYVGFELTGWQKLKIVYVTARRRKRRRRKRRRFVVPRPDVSLAHVVKIDQVCVSIPVSLILYK